MMLKTRRNELFLIIGLLFTQLIHCTWEFGNTYTLMLVLANNIGRCGLFLFVCYMGEYIYNYKSNLKEIIKSICIIYLFTFVANMVVDITMMSYAGLKGTMLQFLRGTPGNIWIIYGALIFSLLLFLYKNKGISISSHTQKIIVGGYCLIALSLFLYANVYSGFISVNNGLVIKCFYKILGTNRSPYILAIPFLLFGVYAGKNNLKTKTNNPIIALILFVLWVFEVVFIYQKTGNYNLHMTFSGVFAVAYMYAYLRNFLLNNEKERDVISEKNTFFFYIVLFSIQYSLNRTVVYYLSLDNPSEYIMWFAAYCVVSLCAITIYHKIGDKNDKEIVE